MDWTFWYPCITKSNSVLSLLWDCSEVRNWKFRYRDLTFWWIGLSDSTVSECPIHQKVQFCSIFSMRLLWGMKLEVLLSRFEILIDWPFWFHCIRKSNSSESPILFYLYYEIALRNEIVSYQEFEFWWIGLSDTPVSESPILFYLYYEIALRYEIESSVIKIWNSDGLDFLIPLYQKVQSIRKSSSVLSLLWDCSEVWNSKFCYQYWKFICYLYPY